MPARADVPDAGGFDREHWAHINSLKKSNGHIFFDGDKEYFMYDHSVFCADRRDPVECTGTRNARWLCTGASWSSSPIYRAIVEKRAKELDALLAAIQPPAPVPQYERGDLP